jgi:hypothetical protein
MTDFAKPIAHLHTELVGNTRGCPPGQALAARRTCVLCRVHDGIASICGRAWAYYILQHGRGRVLVLDLAEEERLRINDNCEVVVLDVKGNHVRLGVLCSPDNGASSRGTGNA